ncbi:MAG: glucosamine inositolphosphorylceramide transferase family protein [Aurantibacter sp.]
MKNYSRAIRFGVISDSPTLFTWQELVLKKLISQADIKLGLVLFGSNSRAIVDSSSTANATAPKSGFLWNIFYNYRIRKMSKALQETDAIWLFEEIPQFFGDFIIDENGFTELGTSTIAKLENAELDFIINFSANRLIGKVIDVAKYGIWCYQFGDPEKYPGNSSCFWEIYNKDLVTRGCLLRLTNEPENVIVLKDGYLKTNILFARNVDKIHLESTFWPLHICQDIKNDNTKFLTALSKIGPNKVASTPSNLELIKFFFVQLELFFKKAKKSFFYTDYWNLGLANAPIEEFLNGEKLPGIKWIPNLPKYRFRADPFGVCFKDGLYIIYEDFRFDQGMGKIASFRFNEGSFVENEIVIDEEFHMSYPFLLEHEDEIYCIPETYQANQVRLYKALEFPLKWKLEKVLIENYAGIDSTVFKFEDTWYLFSTNKNSGPHYNLNIHYSDSIFGPWQEHPKNPVKTDIRSARPAGTMFVHNGALYRPSMDYSEKVEGRISLNRIVKLTTNEFSEQVHTMINPFENTIYADKVHTLSQMGSYTLVDGAKELFVFSNFKALKYKFFRLLQKIRNV